MAEKNKRDKRGVLRNDAGVEPVTATDQKFYVNAQADGGANSMPRLFKSSGVVSHPCTADFDAWCIGEGGTCTSTCESIR